MSNKQNETTFNLNAIIGQAIATAFLRSNFDNYTTMDELSITEFDQVAELAEGYLRWVGLDEEVTHSDIKKAIWGWDENDF